MSGSPVVETPPIADPNWPIKVATGTVDVSDTFNEDDLNFMQSVLFYYEENEPEARASEEALNRLIRVRALLGTLVPTSS